MTPEQRERDDFRQHWHEAINRTTDKLGFVDRDAVQRALDRMKAADDERRQSLCYSQPADIALAIWVQQISGPLETVLEAARAYLATPASTQQAASDSDVNRAAWEYTEGFGDLTGVATRSFFAGVRWRESTPAAGAGAGAKGGRDGE